MQEHLLSKLNGLSLISSTFSKNNLDLEEKVYNPNYSGEAGRIISNLKPPWEKASDTELEILLPLSPQ